MRLDAVFGSFWHPNGLKTASQHLKSLSVNLLPLNPDDVTIVRCLSEVGTNLHANRSN